MIVTRALASSRQPAATAPLERTMWNVVWSGAAELDPASTNGSPAAASATVPAAAASVLVLILSPPL